jgi:hypothetical protein
MPKTSAYVFVDNSNIWIEGKKIARTDQRQLKLPVGNNS